MPLMLVTLDVSKLSGWLNQDASCRVKMRLWGGGGGGNQLDIWSEARAGRTANMAYMSVTLDVSKLSGWLNTDAPCRVERRAYDAGRGVRAGSGRAWAGGSAHAACTG